MFKVQKNRKTLSSSFKGNSNASSNGFLSSNKKESNVYYTIEKEHSQSRQQY